MITELAFISLSLPRKEEKNKVNCFAKKEERNFVCIVLVFEEIGSSLRHNSTDLIISFRL